MAAPPAADATASPLPPLPPWRDPARVATVEAQLLAAGAAVDAADRRSVAVVAELLAHLVPGGAATVAARDNHYEVAARAAPPAPTTGFPAPPPAHEGDPDDGYVDADVLRRAHALGRRLRDEPLVSVELVANVGAERALTLTARVLRRRFCYALPYADAPLGGGGAAVAGAAAAQAGDPGSVDGGGATPPGTSAAAAAGAAAAAATREDTAALEALGFVQPEDAWRVLAAARAARDLVAAHGQARVVVSRAEYAYDVAVTTAAADGAAPFTLAWADACSLRAAVRGDLACVGLVWRPLDGHAHARAHRWWLCVRVPMLQYCLGGEGGGGGVAAAGALGDAGEGEGGGLRVAPHDPWDLGPHAGGAVAACAACAAAAAGAASRQVGYYPGKVVPLAPPPRDDDPVVALLEGREAPDVRPRGGGKAHPALAARASDRHAPY